MLWIWLTLFVAFVFAIINVTDKHIVTDELKDPFLCAVVYGVISFLIFGPMALITKQTINLPPGIVFISLSAGALLSIGTFF